MCNRKEPIFCLSKRSVQTVIEFSVAKRMTQKEKGILSNFHLQWMVRLSMLAKDFTFHTLNDKVYDQKWRPKIQIGQY